MAATPTKQKRGSRVSPVVGRGQPYEYEATRFSRNRTWLNLTGFGGNSAGADGAARLRMAQISRYLWDNNPLVAYAISQIVSYVTPIKPQAATENAKWNTTAEDYFANWARRCDLTGRFTFWSMQEMLSIALDVEGDAGFLISLDDGDPRLQMIEGWRIGNPTDRKRAESFFDGVEVDRFGRVTGYHLDPDDGQVDVDPNEFKLLRHIERYSAYRGVGALRRGANDIRDHQDIKAYLKLGAKIDSSIPAVIEGGPTGEDEWGDDDAAASTDTSFDKTKGNMDLLEGNVPVLPKGQSLKTVETQRPHTNVVDFLDTLAANMVSGLYIPPAFFLDSKLTGPNARAVNGKAQRSFNRRQRIIGEAVEWTWVRVVGQAIDAGRLSAQKGWWRVALQGPPALTIDAGREAQQEREDWRSGIMTHQSIAGKQGDDWQRETDQLFAEDEYKITKAKELADRLDVPLEAILARYGYDAAKSSPLTVPGTSVPSGGPQDDEGDDQTGDGQKPDSGDAGEKEDDNAED